MPFDGPARRPTPEPGRQRPPQVVTWSPRAFSLPMNPQAAEWARFLVALFAGLALLAGLSFLVALAF